LAPFPDQEKEAYQTMLPSLHAVKVMRSAFSRLLHSLQERRDDGTEEDSSARVLLCHRMLDACEEVTRAQGLDECPETEQPGSASLTSTLASMHEACPLLDLTCQGSLLVDEIFRCSDADTEAVPRLIQAVAGVDFLAELGISPSVLALRAARHRLRSAPVLEGEEQREADAAGLAALMMWLTIEDAWGLLVTAMSDQSVARPRAFEVLAHLRATCASRQTNGPAGGGSEWERLHSVLHHARALMLLSSTYRSMHGEQAQLPLNFGSRPAIEQSCLNWRQRLEADPETAAFLPLAEAILRGEGTA